MHSFVRWLPCQSGIQDKDYEVDDVQNEATMVVYGLDTLEQLVAPWTIDVTNMRAEDYRITVSEPLLKGPEFKRWKEDFIERTVSSVWRESCCGAAGHFHLQVNRHAMKVKGTK